MIVLFIYIGLVSLLNMIILSNPYLRGYEHGRVLGPQELENDISAFAEPLDLHLDDIANVEVFAQLRHTRFVHHDPGNADVQGAVHAVLHVVLDEGLDHCFVL